MVGTLGAAIQATNASGDYDDSARAHATLLPSETTPIKAARHIAGLECYSRPRGYSATCISASLSVPTTARKDRLGVVLVCVGPRSRDDCVGEQGQRFKIYLQLQPHKQHQPCCPTLLRLAHPRRANEGEAPRLPSHPEASAPRAPRHCGLHP